MKTATLEFTDDQAKAALSRIASRMRETRLKLRAVPVPPKDIKPGRIVVDIFQPDKVGNETVHAIGYAVIMPWRDSAPEEFNNPDADPRTHVIIREVEGSENDEMLSHRKYIETVLTEREASTLQAFRWPTTLQGFMEAIRTAHAQ